MKYKIIITLIILSFLVVGYGLTFSVFNSNTSFNSNVNIAKFIFNTESLDEFQLALNGIKPGDIREYAFSVNNSNPENISEVTVEYVILLRTYHFIPLNIELYKIVDETEELVMTCDETYIRNESNELVCGTELQELGFSETSIDNYRLKLEFSSEYDSSNFSNLMDYIDIEIKSWQKINE